MLGFFYRHFMHVCVHLFPCQESSKRDFIDVTKFIKY